MQAYLMANTMNYGCDMVSVGAAPHSPPLAIGRDWREEAVSEEHKTRAGATTESTIIPRVLGDLRSDRDISETLVVARTTRPQDAG